MPFQEVSKMESRRQLVHAVQSGMSLSQACLRFGVTRPTGRKWVKRAAEVGIENICELSRAPHTVANRTPEDLELAVVAMKAEHSDWGARKLVPLLRKDKDLHVAVRTCERILDRHGLTQKRVRTEPCTNRFERESCGALLQMDFKGLPANTTYSLLTVLDDHSRFCLGFQPVVDKTASSVKPALWDLFGLHGLPEQMLMDNGDCWGSTLSRMPTRFEVWLIRLGVKPIHGRPAHPQTQGKVERFHGTAKKELKSALVQPSIALARQVIEPWVDRYNWVRPHDSLGGQTPGSHYVPFAKPRPATIPEPFVPDRALVRKVDQSGLISFKGQTYKLGKGLIGERVSILEKEDGYMISLNGYDLSYLHQLRCI